MKNWLIVLFAIVIVSCDILGTQSTLGNQGKLNEEHFQQSNLLQSQNDIKYKHEIVYESLKDKYKGYVTDIMKTLAFLLICIGWFITSDKSRNFFKKNKVIRISAIIALVIIGIIHINASINTYISSKDIISDLSCLKYLDMKFYANYEITIKQLITNLIQNTVLFAVLIIIICSLKEVTHKS